MKKVLLIIVLVLAIFLVIAYISYRNLKIEGDDFERPENCWMTETMIVNGDYGYYTIFEAPKTFLTFCGFKSRNQHFGNSGKSGILSEYTVEKLAEMEAESENDGTYNIYCVFYGTCKPEELKNVYSLINVSLVTDEGVYYLDDEEAFDTSGSYPYLWSSNLSDRVDYSSWVKNPPDGRITLEQGSTKKEEMTAAYGVLALLDVKVKKQGTLHAVLKVDINAEREHRAMYPHSSIEVRGESSTKADPIATVEGVSVGYLTQGDYNDGNYAEESIKSDAVFEDAGYCYMVLDLSIKALANNDGTYSARVLVHAPNHRGDVELFVEEAPTTKLETTTMHGKCALYATYGIPQNAGETKTVRMLIRILPADVDDATVGVFVLGQDGAKLSGDVFLYEMLKTN